MCIRDRLVLVLAVIEHLADRGLGVRGDLDEVETLVVCDAQGVANTKEAELGTVDADESARARSDLPVDARTVVSGYLTHLPFVEALPGRHRKKMCIRDRVRPGALRE